MLTVLYSTSDDEIPASEDFVEVKDLAVPAAVNHPSLDEKGLVPHQAEAARRLHVSLKRPSETRWNSLYFTYEAVIDLRHGIDEYCFRESRNHVKAVDQIVEKNRFRGSSKKLIKEPEPPVPVSDSLTPDD